MNKQTNKLPIPHISEAGLYALWKYANAERLVPRSLMRFEDMLSPTQDSIDNCAFRVALQFDLWGIEIDGMIFHTDLYAQYSKIGAETLKNHQEGKAEKMAKGIAPFLDNNFTFKQFADSAILFKKFGLGEWFEFPVKLKPNNKKRLDTLLDIYLKGFINDKLQIDSINWYKFEKQKESMLDTLRVLQLQFGDTFVLRGQYYQTKNNNWMSSEIRTWFDKTLPLHTLIALEKLGYLDIEAVWVIDMDVPPEDDDTDVFKIRLTLLDKAMAEIDAKYKTPARTSISQPASFDSKTSQLNFQTNKITISKTNNSNPHYLLKAIFKAPAKLWAVDEIWEKLFGKNIEYNPRKHWKKMYNATYDLNEEIAKQTRIRDFVIMKKTTLQLNKKYLK